MRVQCYAGYRDDEEPRAFFLGERSVVVVEIIDRWLAPEHRYFKCLGDDGDTYILRQDVATGRWDLTLFAKGRDQLRSIVCRGRT